MGIIYPLIEIGLINLPSKMGGGGAVPTSLRCIPEYVHFLKKSRTNSKVVSAVPKIAFYTPNVHTIDPTY